MAPGGGNKKSVKSTSRKVSLKTMPPPPAFTRAFFANLLPQDLISLPRDLRKPMAASMWTLARHRKPGTVSIRAFNPAPETDGWTVDHSVLQVVNDDRPFLLDSVTGELQRRGLTIYLSIHPIISVRRDAKGNILGLKGSKNGKESFIHIHFDRTLDPRALDDIVRGVRRVLGDVRLAVSDFPAMLGCLQQIIPEIAEYEGAGIASDEIEETRLFLNWLNADNFIFLGYRKLGLIRKGGALRWKIEPGSSLGILRRESERVFGNLRDRKDQPPEVRRLIKSKCLIIAAKTNQRSRVHRNVPMDAVFIQRFNKKGWVVGEHMFVGLLSSASYLHRSRDIPYLRRKIATVIERAGFDPESHNGRAIVHILDYYPRDELFQIDAGDLYAHAIGIVQLQERARVALFMRKDPFGRFATCLIYVPRDRYDTSVRRKLQEHLEKAFGGPMTNLNTHIDDSPLARVFMTIEIGPDTRWPNHAKLEEELRVMCRSWQDRLRDELRNAFGEARMLDIFKRYGEAFPAAYRDTTMAGDALRDIEALEKVLSEKRFIVALSETGEQGLLRLKLYQPGQPLVLSDVLPLVENMGLKARRMGGPYKIAPCDKPDKVFAHEFVCLGAHQGIVGFENIRPLFEEAFTRLFAGDVENDAFNALTLVAGLTWREVNVMRAIARYLRQLRVPYNYEMMAAALLAHPRTARELIALFHVRHNPDLPGNRQQQMNRLAAKIARTLDGVTVLEEDHILRRYLNFIMSSLRTNYFQSGRDGEPKPYLSIKIDSRAIDFLPLPKPLVEIYIYSVRVEAVHLRGGKVARGGIRWSDRRDDFRNEILGLMKAQMVKNAVIVPVGSKGGFIVKQPPKNPADTQAEGIACYQMMMRGLLDLTDNRIDGRIIPPARVVRHDGDDPYLVVAADKGTATFSDIANVLAREYGFWLDDAFASGGSAGYDHKQMGITARGVWEGVKRHFREIGKDIQQTAFTCVGVGDMSGDVFGNAMLLSKHIRLLAAFDHRHIFCDPDPDTAKSYAERQRLFKLPRSSWTDYDPKKISKGGGVFPRDVKTIRLSPEIKQALNLQADSLSPNELIQAILRSPVELLYFGGIGTYVKASTESQADARDRANDALRVDGRDIQAKVVGEGANLGMTQRGRIEYAQKGGRLNTDAIDNSAGVATSDREVNIKILLRKPVMERRLTLAARNRLLASMAPGVTKLVLRDNYRQTQALSIAEARAVELLPVHARCIYLLEKSGLLNRALEFLPDETEMAERQRLGRGLTRPELAVLLSYSKIWLYDQLLASNLPDDPFLHKDLLYYFPDQLKKNFGNDIGHHQLRREIVATRLRNSLINRVGSHFVFQVMEQTRSDPAAIARAYHLVRAAYGLHALWREIEDLDNLVPAQAQTDMFLAINRMMDYVLPWFLKENEVPAKLKPAIEHYREGVNRVAEWFSKNPDNIGPSATKSVIALAGQGVSKRLATRVAIMPLLAIAPELTRLSQRTACSIEQAAGIFFGLGQRLGLDVLRDRMQTLSGQDTPHGQEAAAVLKNELFDSQRALTIDVLHVLPAQRRNTCGAEELLNTWLEKNPAAMERYDALMEEIRAAASLDLAMLTLVSKRLKGLLL